MKKKIAAILITSFALAIVPNLLLWMHHIFVTGLNPYLGPIFIILVFLLFTATIVVIVRWINKSGQLRNIFTPSTLFTTGVCSWLIMAILYLLFIGDSTLDIHLPDTY